MKRAYSSSAISINPYGVQTANTHGMISIQVLIQYFSGVESSGWFQTGVKSASCSLLV